MFLRSVIIICVFISSTLSAFTIKTISDGDWEDPNVWSNHQVPLSPDSIIIYHYIVLNQNRTINAPSVLYIDSLGTICGDYLLETACGASFVNYGHMYLNQIKTRAGLNYYYISSKNYINISGCPPSGSGYFNNIPPNGSTYVWPPVFCKSVDTNWEGGNQMGIMELENESLKIYPNPTSGESLTIITLSSTKIKLRDIIGNEMYSKYFENRTELNLSKLPKGVYFIEIEITGKKYIRKIVKSD